jgi:Arc/MetJ family transcription regulator
MRTTLEIDRDLLEEAVRVTGAPTKSVAVRLGLKALVDCAPVLKPLLFTLDRKLILRSLGRPSGG